ncbi:hypothetical protein CPC08DRAFT_823966 [Agrocybe pediades]|nr:hypothetical protein CPC08DRAFT_823966 [Agrocybe pediades]
MTATAPLTGEELHEIAQGQFELAIGSYVSVGALSVFIWDLLFNLSHDYDLAKTHGFNITSMIYFMSRLSTLGFVFTETLTITNPMAASACSNIKILASLFYILFVASTLLLSYIRVCVIWNRNRWIVATYGILWLVAIGGSFTVIGGMALQSVQGHCLNTVVHEYMAASVILPTTNHLIVFVAITIGLCRSHTTSIFDIGKGVRLYVFGDTLPAFSKALLQSSQICYIAAVVTGTTTLVWFYAYKTETRYRIALTPLYTAVVNIMFSWVFRKAKLGIFTVIPHSVATTDDNALAGIRSHIPMFGRASVHKDRSSASRSSSMQHSQRADIPQAHEVKLNRSDSLEDTPLPVKVEVDKVVQYDGDLDSTERGDRFG